MAFIFDKMFTAVKDLAGEEAVAAAEAEAAAAKETDASEDVDSACFYMGIDNQEAHVTCDVLNVRQTPSTDKPRVGQLHRGATICVTGVCDDWLAINLQGQTCYVCGKYTDFSAPKATVTASALNIRKKPTTESDKIGSLPNGTSINVIGQENGWVKILHGKNIGYVSAEYLKFD